MMSGDGDDVLVPAAAEPDGIRRSRARWILLLLLGTSIVLATGVRLGSRLFERGDTQLQPVQAAPALPVQRIGGPAELPAGPIDHVEVAYFHRTHRCSACVNAERLARATIDRHFADRVAAGKVSLVIEDTEKPADPALVAKYDAWGSALYLGVTAGGTVYTWRVDDIWFYVNEDHQFISLLARQIDEAMGNA